MRNQPNDILRYPDVLIRTWLADGETSEPDEWLSWWDYFPANPARNGAPGFVALSGESGGGLECDLFLVTAEELPEITVRIPALKPAAPRLIAEGLRLPEVFRFRCIAPAETSWVIETTEDLITWTEANLAHEAGAADVWHDETAAHFPRRFYRARALP